MAIRTTISTLVVSALAEVILVSCNGLVPVDLLGDRIISKLDSENISASMGEIVEALQRLVKGGQLRLKDVTLINEKINVRLEFSKT